jgi:hypothetical protein
MAIWACLLVLLALLRLVPEGWFRRLLRLAWLTTVIAFASVAIPFSISEVRGAFFPSTHPPAGAESSLDVTETLDHVASLGALSAPASAPAVADEQVQGLKQAVVTEENKAAADEVQQAVPMPMKVAKARGDYGLTSSSRDSKNVAVKVQNQLVDPDAIVQTGPGLPSWRWRTVELHWSGPVQRDQRIHFYLLSPFWTTLFGCLRVLCVVGLGFLLIRKTPFGKAPPARVSGLKTAPLIVAALTCVVVLSTPTTVFAQPSEALLSELKTRLTRAPDCETCLEVESLELKVARQTLETRAIVHAGAVATYRIPGPVRSFVPATVLVDGQPSKAMVLGADGFLHVRLEPGSHRVQSSGPVSGSEWVITPGVSSHRVRVLTEGYTVDGLRDGRVEGSLHFTATDQPKQKDVAGADSGASMQRQFPPWLEITRTIELGVTWKITTEVSRKSPNGQPISLRYPLLAGEEVTETSAIVEQRQLVISLGRDDETVSYRSVLKPVDTLALVAQTDRPWNEHWQVRCAALWHCVFSGVAPYAQTDESGYAPKFRPWPGETLQVIVTKPPAAAGATRTIERVNATYTPGKRLLLGELELVAKVSKAGALSIRFEPGVAVQKLSIDGRDEPIRSSGSLVELSLQPGRHTIQLNWHESKPQRFWFKTPSLVIDGQAVNAKVHVRLPSERWLLFTWGPSWGPKVLLWSYLLMLVGAAWILVRIPKNPLRVWQWALLGIGLTQVPVAVALVIAAWFFAMAYRGSVEIRSRMGKRFTQLTLGLYTLLFLGCLCGAVYDGLVSNPDMLVSGAISSDVLDLSWYVDRVQGPLPTSLVLSLPVVVFRLLNLLWALWLASSLIGWLRWAWQQYAQGGLWVPKRVRAVVPTEPSERVEESAVSVPKSPEDGSPEP